MLPFIGKGKFFNNLSNKPVAMWRYVGCTRNDNAQKPNSSTMYHGIMVICL